MLKEIVIEENKGLKYLKDLFLLEKECFEEKAWEEAMLKEELEKPYSICLLAKKENILMGYLLGRVIMDEGELLRIAVKKAFRNKGIGSLLLKGFLERLKKLGIKKIFLEVEENNKRAYNLYTKFGFKPVNFRKEYYGNTSAVVMSCEI
ncbi:MAG: ribosomal protein S18-alanine N-acetyltransferase [Caldimicrobium sp.]